MEVNRKIRKFLAGKYFKPCPEGHGLLLLIINDLAINTLFHYKG